MSGERYTFDTNILFYALDTTSGSKHDLAKRLIATADYDRCFLVLQTLGELCHAFRRKAPSRTQLGYEFVLENMRMFDVVHATSDDLNDAIRAAQEHTLSFWDAMLWAVARRSGCSLLLMEDLQDGRTLGGVTFRNPLVMSQRDLAILLE